MNWVRPLHSTVSNIFEESLELRWRQGAERASDRNRENPMKKKSPEEKWNRETYKSSVECVCVWIRAPCICLHTIDKLNLLTNERKLGNEKSANRKKIQPHHHPFSRIKISKCSLIFVVDVFWTFIQKKVFTVRTMSHFLFLQHRLSGFIFFAFFISLTSTNSTLHFNLEHITLFFILNSGFSIFCWFFCAPRYAVNKIRSRKNRLLVVWVSFFHFFQRKIWFSLWSFDALYCLLIVCMYNIHTCIKLNKQLFRGFVWWKTFSSCRSFSR